MARFVGFSFLFLILFSIESSTLAQAQSPDWDFETAFQHAQADYDTALAGLKAELQKGAQYDLCKAQAFAIQKTYSSWLVRNKTKISDLYNRILNQNKKIADRLKVANETPVEVIPIRGQSSEKITLTFAQILAQLQETNNRLQSAKDDAAIDVLLSQANDPDYNLSGVGYSQLDSALKTLSPTLSASLVEGSFAPKIVTRIENSQIHLYVEYEMSQLTTGFDIKGTVSYRVDQGFENTLLDPVFVWKVLTQNHVRIDGYPLSWIDRYEQVLEEKAINPCESTHYLADDHSTLTDGLYLSMNELLKLPNHSAIVKKDQDKKEGTKDDPGVGTKVLFGGATYEVESPSINSFEFKKSSTTLHRVVTSIDTTHPEASIARGLIGISNAMIYFFYVDQGNIYYYSPDSSNESGGSALSTIPNVSNAFALTGLSHKRGGHLYLRVAFADHQTKEACFDCDDSTLNWRIPKEEVDASQLKGKSVKYHDHHYKVYAFQNQWRLAVDDKYFMDLDAKIPESGQLFPFITNDRIFFLESKTRPGKSCYHYYRSLKGGTDLSAWNGGGYAKEEFFTNQEILKVVHAGPNKIYVQFRAYTGAIGLGHVSYNSGL